MKRLIDKSILALAKVHKDHGATKFVHVYPDGRAMATDGFTLCEIRTVQENQESAPVLEKEWHDLKKPILLPAEAISKKQKFEDGKALPILSNGFLIKSKNKGAVRIRTTNLETTTEVEYRIGEEKPIKYEQLFPEKPASQDVYDVNFLLQLIRQIKECGIREVRFLREEGERKPLVLTGYDTGTKKDLRALIMPVNHDNESDPFLERYREAKSHDSKK